MLKEKEIKPFLRWAGGKVWLQRYLKDVIPHEFNNYHEPFLGGASIFLMLVNNNYGFKQAFLSDMNAALINCYKMVRGYPDEVIEHLKSYTNSKEKYYELREKSPENKIEEAAIFLFLNRTSFNGIYRVNKNGKYNVPYGNKSYTNLFDYENLREASRIFKKANLQCTDFESTLKNIKKDDLVFIDPPYTVTHNNNGFIKYNANLFSLKDQERLCDFLNDIKKRDAYFILTNANHPKILEIFSQVANSKVLSRYSVVGGKSAKRGKFQEIIFSNCFN